MAWVSVVDAPLWADVTLHFSIKNNTRLCLVWEVSVVPSSHLQAQYKQSKFICIVSFVHKAIQL